MKKRVVVAMSGGVDSSVVACVLKEQGYEVVGVTLQLYDYGSSVNQNSKTCCASKDISDAQQVANQIGIKHYTLNYESIFKQEVINDFAESYVQGFTPVPCVRCNQTVKFRDLYQIAKKLNADFLATGHYVQKINDELHCGLDLKKDQSYFLFQTTYEQIQFLEFPLGNLNKSETRELAKKFNLKLALKPDSQDICFVPDGDYAKVVKKVKGESAFKSGNIIDIKTGNVVGRHEGIINYTIGQRKRISVPSQVPLYVIKIDAKNNQIFVGTEEFLLKTKCEIEDFNLTVKNESLIDFENLTVKVRSSGDFIPCYFDIQNKIITLKEYTKSLAPGQAAVFYNNSKMIGGGFIKKIFDAS
jgi:tRNA-uridine 2-sulfurtransferase